MGIPLLRDIAIIIGTSVAVLYICRLMRIPTIVGFLLSGVLIGPFGLRFVTAIHDVETLAEVGVVLLLFTIGLEFSLKRLWKIRRIVIGGGVLQVALTSLAGFAIFAINAQDTNHALFFGFLIALSSTAIVLKSLQETSQMESPHGRVALGILIFQDIAIIPMILLTPVLGGVESTQVGSMVPIPALLKGILIVGVTIVAANWIVCPLLYRIAKTRSNELFLLSIVLICLAVAYVTQMAGLSLALGAFLAGLVISETEYRHETLGNMLPFRNLFMTFFFVSIGMMLDVSFLAGKIGLILPLAIGVLLIKFVIATFTAFVLGNSARTSVISGLALCQIGEFSFILSREGVTHGLISGDTNQIFLAVAIISMAVTPMLIQAGPALGNIVSRFDFRRKDEIEKYPAVKPKFELTDHLVIIGFGLIGSNVAKTAKVAGIPYIIIEMNPETVRTQQLASEPIIYGDATREIILEHARIKNARIVLIAINDPFAVRRITQQARSMNPRAYIIVRTRYVDEMKSLYDKGANEVIPEEFETSVEIFARILERYFIPKSEIDRLISEIRSGSYEMLRSRQGSSALLSDLNSHFSDINICTLNVPENSGIINQTLGETSLRGKFGITVVAIKRGSEFIPNPGSYTILQAGDNLFALGTREQIASASSLFDSSCKL